MTLHSIKKIATQNCSLVLDLLEATTNERSVPQHELNIKVPARVPMASPQASQVIVPSSQAYIMEKLQGQDRQDWTGRLFHPGQFD